MKTLDGIDAMVAILVAQTQDVRRVVEAGKRDKDVTIGTHVQFSRFARALEDDLRGKAGGQFELGRCSWRCRFRQIFARAAASEQQNTGCAEQRCVTSCHCLSSGNANT